MSQNCCIAIIIPVYRIPTEYEKISLRQCCKVLGRYDHFLVAPEGLDTTEFHALWAEGGGLKLREERFNADYFKGVKGYNRLCLSRESYARFDRRGYSHVLIYQPDAFIFCGRIRGMVC